MSTQSYSEKYSEGFKPGDKILGKSTDYTDAFKSLGGYDYVYSNEEGHWGNDPEHGNIAFVGRQGNVKKVEDKRFVKGGETKKEVDMSSDSPKIYVADLAAYNDGSLEGEWLDLADYSDGEAVMEAISEIVDGWKEKDESHEEWEIHDTENILGSLKSESMGESDFDEIIKLWEKYQETDVPMEVIQQWVNDGGRDIDSFSYAYLGKYDSEEDFAESMVNQGVMSPGNDVYITDTDKRIIADEEADNRLDGMDDDDMIKEADLTSELDELEEKQGEKDDAEDIDDEEKTEEQKELENFDFDDEKEKLVDRAKSELHDQYYNEVHDALDDPIQYFVHDNGLYSEEDLLKANFIRVDYEALAKELGMDYTFIEHDGDVYVFNDNYAKGGKLGKQDEFAKIEKSFWRLNDQKLRLDKKRLQAVAKDDYAEVEKIEQEISEIKKKSDVLSDKMLAIELQKEDDDRYNKYYVPMFGDKEVEDHKHLSKMAKGHLAKAIRDYTYLPQKYLEKNMIAAAEKEIESGNSHLPSYYSDEYKKELTDAAKQFLEEIKKGKRAEPEKKDENIRSRYMIIYDPVDELKGARLYGQDSEIKEVVIRAAKKMIKEKQAKQAMVVDNEEGKTVWSSSKEYKDTKFAGGGVAGEEVIIDGIRHKKVKGDFDWHGLKTSGIHSGHPLGEYYIKGNKGYVQSGYDWLEFDTDDLKKKKQEVAKLTDDEKNKLEEFSIGSALPKLERHTMTLARVYLINYMHTFDKHLVGYQQTERLLKDLHEKPKDYHNLSMAIFSLKDYATQMDTEEKKKKITEVIDKLEVMANEYKSAGGTLTGKSLDTDDPSFPDDIYWALYSLDRRLVDTEVKVSRRKDGTYELTSEDGGFAVVEPGIDAHEEKIIYEYLAKNKFEEGGSVDEIKEGSQVVYSNPEKGEEEYVFVVKERANAGGSDDRVLIEQIFPDPGKLGRTFKHQTKDVKLAPYDAKNKFENGGSVEGVINWNDFTLNELSKYVKGVGDVEIVWFTKKEGPAPVPHYVDFKKYGDKKLSIGEVGKELYVLQGSENLYLDITVYDEEKKAFVIGLFSKENRDRLKEIQNAIVKKFSKGGKLATALVGESIEIIEPSNGKDQNKFEIFEYDKGGENEAFVIAAITKGYPREFVEKKFGTLDDARAYAQEKADSYADGGGVGDQQLNDKEWTKVDWPFNPNIKVDTYGKMYGNRAVYLHPIFRLVSEDPEVWEAGNGFRCYEQDVADHDCPKDVKTLDEAKEWVEFIMHPKFNYAKGGGVGYAKSGKLTNKFVRVEFEQYGVKKVYAVWVDSEKSAKSIIHRSFGVPEKEIKIISNEKSANGYFPKNYVIEISDKLEKGGKAKNSKKKSRQELLKNLRESVGN